ncbi:MAG: Usg family protein [Parvibaculum sp.]|nr:Usg family protein [Parvibaculum sp.]
MLRDTREFAKMIDGYRLVTAEILYRMPDHPGFLQTFVWQDYDLEPKYPTLTKFLDYWEKNLDGPLFSVRIATKRVITPAEFPYADFMGVLH